MNSYIKIRSNPTVKGIVNQLPSSKSLSNRALILNALTGNRSVVSNLSNARDTKLMMALVGSEEKTIDVMDAGTTMRFLTAYFALTSKNKIMTGTDRMKQRPIKLLVDALRQLGAKISYLGEEGFPPIELQGFDSQKTDHIEIPGNVSSQYISALMMLGPTLPKGLILHLTGETGSVPYITMTATLMKDFGAKMDLNFEKNTIHVHPGNLAPSQVTIEADWSAASYWFGFTALAADANLVLPNVSEQSLQGDRVVVEIMEKIGVTSLFKSNNLHLSKSKSTSHLVWDFKDCPDLAQTILPVCAAKGISGEFTGLESLRIKETDRIAALQNELAKIGATLSEPATGRWRLTPGNIHSLAQPIATYHDHRMAMGFAPWATLRNITIEAPEVVNKSYPGYWDDLATIGFTLER